MFNRRHLPLALAAATAALALAPAAVPAPIPAAGVVTNVVDGDTLKVRVAGVVRTVDLAGIDAPELRGGECFAKAAHRRLRASVAVGGTVRFAFTGRRPGSRAKRFAALVRVDGTLLNRRMVIGGFARTDGADLFAQGAVLVAAEVAAQDAARGLWGVCEGFTPGGGDAAGQPATPAAPAAPAIPATPASPSDAQLRDLFNRLLKGKAILRETSDAFSLTQRKINFCSDGSYREVVNTVFSTSGGATLNTTDGTWTIIRTGATGQFAGAVITLDAPGTADDRTIEIDQLADGSLLLDGRPATPDTNSECA